MCRILIFGGTTEGRVLASYCVKNRIRAWVSVVSGYGEMVLPENEYLSVQKEPMDETQMEEFIRKGKIRLVFDATHPFAAEASRNIKAACIRTGASHYRVLREPAFGKEKDSLSETENGVWVDSAEEAVRYLGNKKGNVFVTTGSKELSAFTRLDSWQHRVYARVLPSSPVLKACEEMGFTGPHLIAMQGPFSVQLNRAFFHQLNIRYLVTKETGKAGGFPEKMEAAKNCSIVPVIIGRPVEENGISLEEARDILAQSVKEDGVEFSNTVKKTAREGSKKRKVFLVGIGMGGPGQLSVTTYAKLSSCQVAFGAARMLESAGKAAAGAVLKEGYLSEEILPWLEAHPEFERSAVLYSGDTGFYSGAKKMAETLKQEPYSSKYEIEMIPGISSVTYFCARLHTSWEDVRLVSLHGRQCDVIEEVKEHLRTFVLLDDVNTVKRLCQRLIEEDLKEVVLSVGEKLSYPDERILIGTPKKLLKQEIAMPAVVLIERAGL